MKAGSSANSTLGRTLRMRPSRPSPICASTPVCHWPAKSPPIKNTASKASSATHDSHATLTALQQNPTCCRHDAYRDPQGRAATARRSAARSGGQTGGAPDAAAAVAACHSPRTAHAASAAARRDRSAGGQGRSARCHGERRRRVGARVCAKVRQSFSRRVRVCGVRPAPATRSRRAAPPVAPRTA